MSSWPSLSVPAAALTSCSPRDTCTSCPIRGPSPSPQPPHLPCPLLGTPPGDPPTNSWITETEARPSPPETTNP